MVVTQYRYVLFSDWEAVSRISLAMIGLASYLANIEQVVALAGLPAESLIQMMTIMLGLAYQELLC